MTEDKKELNKNLRQNTLPPRPLPPRPTKPLRPQVEQKEIEQREIEKNVVEQNVVEQQQKEESQNSNASSPANSNGVVKKRSAQQKTKKTLDSKDSKQAPQEEKIEDGNSKNSSKKRFFVVLALITLALCIAIIVTVVVVCRPKQSALNTPQNLRIIEAEDKIYALCDQVDGAKKYVFQIDGRDYDNKTCSFDLSVLSTPKKYHVRVYAVGDSGSMSKPTKAIYFNLTKTLETPIIHFYEAKSNIVCWAEVENATSYEIMLNNEIVETQDTQFSLNELDGGEYVVQVRAKTNKTGYNNSSYSNSLKGVVYKKLEGVDAELLDQNKIKIYRVNHASHYNVTINNKTFAIDQFLQDSIVIDPLHAGVDGSITITYLKIEAVGEKYYISSSKEISV